MTDERLLKKLQYKPDMSVLVMNAPDSFLDAIRPLPGSAAPDTETTGEGYDYVHLFAQDSDELARHTLTALRALKPDGLLWISYPKKSAGMQTDLTRDEGWEILEKAGYRGVRQVAIDDTWSAVRFRPRGDESPQALINAQYAGPKAHLWSLYERLVGAALDIDPEIKLAPRKSYVALQKNKTFALIKPSTKSRLDLGLKLPAYEATERLQESAGFGSGSITHKVALESPDDIDDQLLAWLRAAYETVT